MSLYREQMIWILWAQLSRLFRFTMYRYVTFWCNNPSVLLLELLLIDILTHKYNTHNFNTDIWTNCTGIDIVEIWLSFAVPTGTEWLVYDTLTQYVSPLECEFDFRELGVYTLDFPLATEVKIFVVAKKSAV